MTWKEYTEELQILFHRFGAYSKEEIDKGFKRFKDKPRHEFSSWIMNQTSRPMLSYEIKPFIPKQVKPYQDNETLIITDNYLDNLKKQHGVESIVELIIKKK